VRLQAAFINSYDIGKRKNSSILKKGVIRLLHFASLCAYIHMPMDIHGLERKATNHMPDSGKAKS